MKNLKSARILAAVFISWIVGDMVFPQSLNSSSVAAGVEDRASDNGSDRPST